jgi:hypothetical protein
MKFINYLEKVTGVDIYALSSFVIFFSFFVVMLLWALKADKKMINEISQLPLDD